jgi:hypothetical protein
MSLSLITGGLCRAASRREARPNDGIAQRSWRLYLRLTRWLASERHRRPVRGDRGWHALGPKWRDSRPAAQIRASGVMVGPVAASPGRAGGGEPRSGAAEGRGAPGRAGPRRVTPGCAGPRLAAPGHAWPRRAASGRAGLRRAAQASTQRRLRAWVGRPRVRSCRFPSDTPGRRAGRGRGRLQSVSRSTESISERGLGAARLP